MRFGLMITNLGEYGDPRTARRLAQVAEASGWEGLFVWDHLAFVWGVPSGDPWVILAAVAATTRRLRLGTAVAPLPRYRPHLLAQRLATLDILSEGRIIFGVGLGGVPEEFAAFGEPGDAKARAAMADEGLEVLTDLWSGVAVTHRGPAYTVEGVTLAPLPVQRPRIPIWIGGGSGAALRRAARWDGWLANSSSETAMTMTPDQLAAHLVTIASHRAVAASFEVAVTGYSAPADAALARSYAEAGATWWLEGIHGLRGSLDEMLARIGAGPPS